MKTLALGLIVLILGIFTACGGGSMSGTNPPPPPPPPPPPTLNASITVDSTKNGPFNLAMSTSFQPAEWDNTFFQDFPNATTPLGNLLPHHIRLQGISQGVPETTTSSWNFTVLDAITQPVLGVGDHSPEFQVAKAPAYMYTNNDANSYTDKFLDPTYGTFAAYAANLVRYYNTGGFTSLDNAFHVSPAYPNEKIAWWGIYNEPSINNFTTQTSATPDLDYTTMYNKVVPAMQGVDPSIKFVALELCCSSENWVQTFAANVTTQVDAVATHYYSICAPASDFTDAQVFHTVSGFATSIQTIYGYLSANAALSNVPVWVTENNVNADFDAGGGISACTGKGFVLDQRGSSPFFAAWRPYVFSQVGRAGAQALYHWDFGADQQYGEMNASTGQLQLSYWVDYWLGQMFPAGSGQLLLGSSNSDTTDIEVLPVVNADGSIVVMIANHAVASPTDNNGAGLTADISLDTSALGSFTSARELIIDSSTNASTGPSPVSVAPASPLKLSLNGYSVAFIKLQ